jgi:glycosyltransferase involved in cell wall biosynthesis
MSPRVCSVATTAAAEHGSLLAARLRGLLDAGWDARLLCNGERWAADPAIRDPALAPNVELMPERDTYPPPRSLLSRPGGLVSYLRAEGDTGAFDECLLRLRPDLIHFHSARSARQGMRLKRILGCRVVVGFRADGSDIDQPNPEILWEGADLLVFADAALRGRAIARGCRPETAEVLPIPLKAALDGRRPDPGPLRLISVGPLSWEQGFEHSVHAVRHLLDSGVGCRYRILGEGDHLNAVAFARHQFDLAESVDLALPEGGGSLVDELLAADVFLDPAVTDTTSLTPLRTAAALGLPFVATHRDGLSDDAGITVSRRNSRAIAEALGRLALDSALRDRMGEAGRAKANPHPTLEEHLRRLQSLYRRALA